MRRRVYEQTTRRRVVEEETTRRVVQDDDVPPPIGHAAVPQRPALDSPRRHQPEIPSNCIEVRYCEEIPTYVTGRWTSEPLLHPQAGQQPGESLDDYRRRRALAGYPVDEYPDITVDGVADPYALPPGRKRGDR